jgi:hypothetical protein
MNEFKRPQNAVPRTTEGIQKGQSQPGSNSQRGVTRPDKVEPRAPGQRGRPKGSKNKPKGIVPTELANEMLLAMKDMLPPDHFEYMRGVIRDGNAISTRRELDTLILLLSRNLYPALVMESMGTEVEEDDEDFFNDDPDAPPAGNKAASKKLKMPIFRKDVTERLKVLQSLLAQKEKSERAEAEAGHEKPILQVFGRSGVNADRLRILVGVESGTVAGDFDPIERGADEVGAVSDKVLDGQELLSSGKQG